MYRIYLERRCIIICPPYDQALADPNAVQFCPGERIDMHTLTGMFEASGSLGRIYIPSDDTEAVYRKICSEFREVNAGGGLVSNRRGDFLLIRRNGLWDLPKGHQGGVPLSIVTTGGFFHIRSCASRCAAGWRTISSAGIPMWKS